MNNLQVIALLGVWGACATVAIMVPNILVILIAFMAAVAATDRIVK